MHLIETTPRRVRDPLERHMARSTAARGMGPPMIDRVPDIPFLREVPEAIRRDLLESGRLTTAEPGQEIIRHGDPAGDLIILVEGRLRVSVVSLSGRELIFRLVDPVQPVGEVAALDGGLRTANVVAATHCLMLVLPRLHCLRMIGAHPALAMAMLSLLCARLRETSLGLERAAIQRLPSRMAHLLLKLADEYGRPGPDGSVILPMRLSQGEMASLVAATREAVNKQLADWREAGVLGIERGHFLIHRPGALAEACE